MNVLMNVFPQIGSPKSSRAWRGPLLALMFFLPALLSAQDVLVHVNGQTGVITGYPPLYNGQYVIQQSTFGFFWLDTVSLTGGHVQAITVCVAELPTSDSPYVLAGGDCNAISDVATIGTQVVAKMWSGQCGAQRRGCNGPRDDGHMLLAFKLGSWEYTGDGTDIASSTQAADLQGRTWTVRGTDSTYRNFVWHATGGVPPTPTPTPTPAAVPPTARATATNLSAQVRGDSVNYYGDKWQLQDSSAPGPLTRIDWDFNYKAPFLVDETGAPAGEGTVTGYFPCDPNGVIVGTFRTGASCIQSLALTNPPASGSYQFAMQSANQYGTSPNTFTSPAFPVVCPQAGIVGYTGSTGTCVKSGGTLTVLTGGNADAGASLGNLAEASFAWTFTGSSPISLSTNPVPVPAGATAFTLTITFPGGYQATASGTVAQTSLVPRFSLAPNPVLRNTTLTLTNQMDKLTTTTLDSVDYQVATGACGPAPSTGYTLLANASTNAAFLAKPGTAPVTAPSTVSSYCVYLRYNFTPQAPPQQSLVASNGFTVTDSTPTLGIFTDSAATQQAGFFGGALQLSAGTTYYLKDTENVAPPSAHFYLNSGSGDVELSGSPTVGPGPLAWTPSAACPSGCTVKVSTGTAADFKPVVISGAQGPTPTPTSPPSSTPTPTPPGGGGGGGTVSVFLNGPSTGSRGTPVGPFTASASGGSGSYTYSWACNFSQFSPSFSQGQQTMTCTYQNAGSYTIVVRAVDSLGVTGYSAGNVVTITGGLPAPSSASTLSGPTLTLNTFNGRYTSSSGSPITFTASDSDANATFAWDYGDGSPAGSGRVVTHTYNTSGSYSARLTASGNGTTTSGTASATIAIDISGPPAPSAAYTLDGATATGTDAYDIEAQKQVVATATETKASKYDWDFGDGTAANGKVVVHAWSTPGARTLKLTVTGNGTDTGGSRSVNIAMNVTPVKFKAVIVPGAAHLDLGASVWGTDVSVSNPGSGTLTITPNFVPYVDGGSDTLDVSQIAYDPSLSFQLAPGASWSQVDVVKFLNGGSNKGTLIFKYEGSDDPVVTARVYFASSTDPRGASYGAAFPSYKVTGSGGVSTSGAEQVDVTGEQTLIGLRSDSLYRFRVTLFNADSKAGTFRLTAYDQAGTQQYIKDASGALAGFREFQIGPYQQAAPSDVDLGLDKDASKRYVLKASRKPNTSSGTLIAFGTALDRKTSDLNQISDDTPSALAESGVISYYLSGVSHLDTSRAQWRTDLRIYNKSSSARVLGFEYYFTKGTGRPEQKAQVVNVPIPANGLLTFDDVVDSLMKQDTATDLTGDTAGMLRILHFEDADSSNPLVISSRNYDDPSDGSGTAGTRLGVYSSALTTTTSGAPLVMPGGEDSERFYSVVGLFSIDATPTTGRISAVGADGKEVGFYDFELNKANGFGRFGQIFLRDLKDPSNPGSPATIPSTPVTIRVTVTQGGRVGGYTVNVDLKTNDLTFIQGRPLS